MKNLLTSAYEHTDFYKKKFDSVGLHPRSIVSWDDFARVPTTTKDELIAAGKGAVVPRHARKAFISCSSGSSGKRLSVYQNDQFWIQDGLIGVAEFKKRFDYRAGDVSLYANTSAYPFSSIGGRYKIEYFDNLLPSSSLYDLLSRQRPSFFMVYPSIAVELMDHMRAKGLEQDFHFKGIVTHSEQSTQPQRDMLGNFFDCPVFDEYATEELGRVAIQCRFQAYHVIEMGSYTEILSPTADVKLDDGEVGEMVGTCLINEVMPLIRYRQGALASMSPSKCPCGLPGRVIRDLMGRKNDSFQLPDGRTLASGRILDWSYGLFLSLKLDVSQFQIVQTDHDKVQLRVVAGPAFQPARDGLRIAASFRESFGSALTMDVKQVEQIEKTKSGKYLPILRQVQPRPGPSLATGAPTAQS